MRRVAQAAHYRSSSSLSAFNDIVGITLVSYLTATFEMNHNLNNTNGRGDLSSSSSDQTTERFLSSAMQPMSGESLDDDYCYYGNAEFERQLNELTNANLNPSGPAAQPVIQSNETTTNYYDSSFRTPNEPTSTLNM